MSFGVGAIIGPYQITGILGAGGMGEVYRAHDARLGRDVALKVLPDLFSHDPERLARFQREAHVLASLTHPNIGAIYGLEESPSTGPGHAGVRALVLELIEGDTLEDRIARGPLPLDDALPIAKQIAEALAAAHDQGVIHRDLKPSNIKVNADGGVKVLDFGLAKLTGGDAATAASHAGPAALSMSPTITSPAATGVGVILGTAAYMAPEQAKGRPADKRSDVWAFGCVLFEMLAGKRAFEGEDIADTLATVLKGEPDWSALPAEVSPALRTLLTACLAKDRRQRIADIAAALFVIAHQSSFVTRTQGTPPAQVAPLRKALWRRAAPSVAGMVVAAALAGYAGWMMSPAPERTVTRFTITLPDGDRLTSLGRTLVAMSPAGSHFVYAANDRLYLRALDQLEAVPVRGTEGTGAAGPQNPFFSPDGRWIGYWADGQLRKVALSGGAPVTLCATENPFGAHWGPDNTIVFGRGPGGIWRVSGNGGMPENIIKVESGRRAHGPQMLPGGRAVLFTLGEGNNWDQAQIVVQSLEAGAAPKVLINGGRDARYVPTGHLVYGLEGALFAVPFDLSSLTVTAGPVALVENVRPAGPGVTGGIHFTTSSDGTLVYLPGLAGAAVTRTLAWVDRQGREERVAAPARPYVYLRLSPDGTRVALDIADVNRDIWTWDLARGTLTRLTFDPTIDRQPVWTPDGRRIIFSSDRAGNPNLFWQSADGTGAAERLVESDNSQFAMSISPDGSRLVVREASGTTSIDLMVLALTPPRRAEPLVQTQFREENGEISPDGRWLAYEANTSGRDEIYVRPFPDAATGQWQVSTSGGTQPLWSRDGRELFYRAPDGAVMRVAVERGTIWTAGTPTQVLEGRYWAGSADFPYRTYDVAADGRFLMIKDPEGPAATAAVERIIVVQNWFEELKRRVPTP